MAYNDSRNVPKYSLPIVTGVTRGQCFKRTSCTSGSNVAKYACTLNITLSLLTSPSTQKRNKNYNGTLTMHSNHEDSKSLTLLPNEYSFHLPYSVYIFF